MSLSESSMLALGTEAPDFALPDTEGSIVRRDDFRGAPGLAVAFICNHCPFVQHIADGLAAFGREYGERGLGIVAINANDPGTHPADSPERMREEKTRRGYPFPYLFDESQAVARAYGAVCTPDFFLFDGDFRLVYRGRFDGSTPGREVPVTGADLRAAADALLAGRPVPEEQRPSMGCNIKWRRGNAPAYAR